MKKAGLTVGAVLGLSLLALGLLSGAGCKKNEECQVAETCGSKTLSACCTDTQCRYLSSDGTSFSCNGTDCQSAAIEAVAWCKKQ